MEATEARFQPPQDSSGSDSDSLIIQPVAATPASTGPAVGWRHRRRIKRGTACVECKQAKIKCSLLDGLENSCQRCTNLCYKCTPQVRRGTHGWGPPGHGQLEGGGGASSSRTEPQDRNDHAPIQRPLPRAPAKSNALSSRGGRRTPPPLVPPPPTESRVWGSVVLSGDEIDAHFQTYIAIFHPHFPILHRTLLREPNVSYETSELLFWTIILIACRHHDHNRETLNFLVDAIPAALWPSLSSPPLSLASTNTLLLLCTWPLPSIRFITDPSPILVGIAMNSCLLLGLHTKPGGHRDFLIDTSSTTFTNEEATLTWAGYNIASQHISSYLGLPSTNHFNQSIDTLLLPSPPRTGFQLPTHFVCLLGCSRLLTRVSKAMAAQLLAFSGVSTASIVEYEEEFAHLKARFTSSIPDSHITLSLRATIMEIQIYYFLPPPTTPPSPPSQDHILRTYNTARRLLSSALDVDARSTSAHAAGGFPLRTAPHWLFRSILLAACVVFRVLLSGLGNSGVPQFGVGGDAEKRAVVGECIGAMKACSVLRGDLPERAAGLFQAYWDFSCLRACKAPRSGGAARGGNEELCLEFRQRLGASVAFDCVKRWKRHSPSNTRRAGTVAGADDSGVRSSTNDAAETGIRGGDEELEGHSVDWGSFLEDFEGSTFPAGF